MDKAGLISLAERLEQADGPSRELDRAVLDLVGLPMTDALSGVTIMGPDADGKCFVLPGSPTTSLDACRKLHERLLPGWGWQVTGPEPNHRDEEDFPQGWAVLKPVAEYCPKCGANWLSPQKAHDGRPATPQLAWLAMICRALAAEIR